MKQADNQKHFKADYNCLNSNISALTDICKSITSNELNITKSEFMGIFRIFKDKLNDGSVRIVEFKDGVWDLNAWVKKFILQGFKFGMVKECPVNKGKVFDKETLGARNITKEDNVRIVSSSVSIRDGAYLAPGVICMPPSFINIGAYVDEGTMVDSNTVIGSCAYVGKNVHVSAGTQIGGVLEPVGDFPVRIEDRVFVGANSGVYEGTWIQSGCIIAAGTILTRSTPVYDIVREKIYVGTNETPLTIPQNAVVIPGAREMFNNPFDTKLSIQTPIIIKYIDDMGSSVKFEELLRITGLDHLPSTKQVACSVN